MHRSEIGQIAKKCTKCAKKETKLYCQSMMAILLRALLSKVLLSFRQKESASNQSLKRHRQPHICTEATQWVVPTLPNIHVCVCTKNGAENKGPPCLRKNKVNPGQKRFITQQRKQSLELRPLTMCLKGLFIIFSLSFKSHILDSNGVWYS